MIAAGLGGSSRGELALPWSQGVSWRGRSPGTHQNTLMPVPRVYREGDPPTLMDSPALRLSHEQQLARARVVDAAAPSAKAATAKQEGDHCHPAACWRCSAWASLAGGRSTHLHQRVGVAAARCPRTPTPARAGCHGTNVIATATPYADQNNIFVVPTAHGACTRQPPSCGKACCAVCEGGSHTPLL